MNNNEKNHFYQIYLTNFKHLFSVFILLTIFIHSDVAHSAGIITHTLIGARVVNKDYDIKELNNILKHNKNNFYGGLVFPDYALQKMKANLSEGGYCDFPHLQNMNGNSDDCIGDGKLSWATTYANSIIYECRGKSLNNCSDKIAFLFGSLTHLVTDAYFDYHFVGKGDDAVSRPTKNAYKQCFQRKNWDYGGRPVVGIEAAEIFTDQNMDICLGYQLQHVNAYIESKKQTAYDRLRKYCRLKQNKMIQHSKSPVLNPEKLRLRRAVQFIWNVPHLKDFNKIITETLALDSNEDWQKNGNRSLVNAVLLGNISAQNKFRCLISFPKKIKEMSCPDVLQVRPEACPLYLTDLIDNNKKTDVVRETTAESSGFIRYVYNAMNNAINTDGAEIEITREGPLLYRLKDNDGKYYCAGEPRINHKVGVPVCQ